MAVYNSEKQLNSFKLDGQLHQFVYVKDGSTHRLSAWRPPVGEMMKFSYQPEIGILEKIGTGATLDLDHVETIKTAFPEIPSGGTLADEFRAKRDPANYWIIEDRDRTYAYGLISKDKKAWDPANVTVTYRSGLSQTLSYAEKRGTLTTMQDGAEKVSYYYRAPGQKYDGKLRRVEINGAVKVDYRYDRKTGLLTEMVDSRESANTTTMTLNSGPAPRSIQNPSHYASAVALVKNQKSLPNMSTAQTAKSPPLKTPKATSLVTLTHRAAKSHPS